MWLLGIKVHFRMEKHVKDVPCLVPIIPIVGLADDSCKRAKQASQKFQSGSPVNHQTSHVLSKSDNLIQHQIPFQILLAPSGAQYITQPRDDHPIPSHPIPSTYKLECSKALYSDLKQPPTQPVQPIPKPNKRQGGADSAPPRTV